MTWELEITNTRDKHAYVKTITNRYKSYEKAREHGLKVAKAGYLAVVRRVNDVD